MSEASAPEPYGPVASARQLLWHRREFYGFLHFTTNTFTDKEWGYGDEAPSVFAPTDFDAEQIVGAAADAGMAGLILTCKHHDGFCLWPSKHTEHSVKNSPWRDGKGDVVREISDACRARGIGFGVYLSPWDRNHPDYGTPAYIDYFRAQLHELTTEYGDVFEVWFDGANGGDGYYGGARETRSIDRTHYYDWEHTREIVRRNQPNAVMFSDAGPDVRWVGNEKGIAGDPCWASMPSGVMFPGIDGDTFKTQATDDMVAAWGSPQDLLNAGDRDGDLWLPAECDVSIRPGWFYHAAEDERVRTPENLVDLHFASIGRGASFLLNLPPDRRGRIHEADLRSLQGYRARMNAIFGNDLARAAQCSAAQCSATQTRDDDPVYAPANVVDGNPETYWATDDDAVEPKLVLAFAEPVSFNVVSLREFLPLGQRIDRWAIDIDENGTWVEWCTGEAIGARRLLRGPARSSSRLRLRILEQHACPALSEWGVFFDPQAPELKQ